MVSLAQVYVLSPKPMTGNPLAVVFDAGLLADAAMQRFATWTNVSETVFLLPPDDPTRCAVLGGRSAP